MDVQLVIGAGAIGAATAQLLADRGERVRLVTRSGGGPEHSAVERVAADASDADALSRLAAGAAVIYSCAGPAYHRWATDWPPLAAALPRVLAGKRAWAPAALDVPHSWTYTGDVARTLLAVAADARSWGRAWHVPTGPPTSFREVATRAAELAGVPALRLSVMPYPVLWLAGLFNPLARASRETQYQIRKPFVLDSTAATEAFGISPAPLDDALRETIADLRSRS